MKAIKRRSRVAAIQMCSTDCVTENLATASELVQQASELGAELVVLPEMFACFPKQLADQLSIKEVWGDGQIQSFAAETAKRYGIWLVAGSIPLKTNQPNKIRSACLVFDHEGRLRGRYDKTHLFDVKVSETESYCESSVVEPGDAITVLDTPFGKLGLSVCYDLRFPGLFTKMMNQGAEIIAVPAAFTQITGQAHWHLLTRARALDSFCYLIAAAETGKHASGRQTYGHALIVNPWGEIIDEAQSGKNAVVCADIDLSKLQEIRVAIPKQYHQIKGIDD